MINATLRMTATEQTRPQILRVLRSLIEPIRVEPGCISCALYSDVQDPNQLILMQEWRTHSDLERHLRTPQYRKILEVLDMSADQPVLRFNEVVETKGLTLVAKLRGVQTD